MVVVLSLISCILSGVLIEFIIAPKIADILIKISDSKSENLKH